MASPVHLRRLLLPIAWLLLLAGPAAGQSQTQLAQQWWMNADAYQSRYYAVRTDLPRASSQMLAMHMDRMCDGYQRILSNFRQRKQFRLQLCLFSSNQSYQAVLKHRFGVNGAGSGGMCITDGSDITLAAPVGGDPSRVLGTLQHEGFHQYARAMFKSMPPWANEGMAEIFESAVVIGDRVIVGEVPAGRLNFLLAASEQRRLQRLQTLMSMDGEDWGDRVQEGAAGVNYAEAWALVHFFLYAENARYQRSFFEFLAQMNRGSSWESSFFAAFGTRDYDAMESKFLQYLHGLRPTSFRTTLHRLEFLAEGASKLAEGDVYPKTLQEMQTQLKAIEFKHVIEDSRRTITIDAADPKSFLIPPGGSDGPRFELLAREDQKTPEKNPEKERKPGRRKRQTKASPLPARIITTGLFPRTFGIDWKRDRRGRLSYMLVTD